jgi:PAS domain-containing protein
MAADRALRESESRHRALLEALPQLVWTCAEDGACDYFNPQ